jgi:hypothetical protein
MPWRSSCMAAVWRSTCGVTLPLQRRALPCGAAPVAGDQSLDGIPAQRPAATAREGRRGRLGRALAEPLRQNRDRFRAERGDPLFRPFPSQRTWAPPPRMTSQRRRPMSSDTLSPVWMPTNSRARSRRPIQVVRSGAASSAATSSAVSYSTSRRS